LGVRPELVEKNWSPERIESNRSREGENNTCTAKVGTYEKKELGDKRARTREVSRAFEHETNSQKGKKGGPLPPGKENFPLKLGGKRNQARKISAG